MRHIGLAGGLLAAGIMAWAGAAEARTNRALLVAVTAYHALGPKVTLVGPNHDAALVRDYLLNAAPVKFEAKDVTLLADGLAEAAGSPSHGRILAELKKLADEAQRDDFIYLHFSGHGAQEPEASAENETDGLDEIFLPADTSQWVDRAKGVPNALKDDEIGAALDAIRAKGAFVWVIFDSCHSGTATRAAPIDAEEVAERKVDSDTLGIPQAEMDRAEAAAAGRAEVGDEAENAGLRLSEAEEPAEPASRGLDGGNLRQGTFAVNVPTGAESTAKGRMVAFFAAQTIETTPEMRLPKDDKSAPKYGLFTYTIFQKLAENPNLTYRQLGASVIQQYSADGRQRPTPLFEGALDTRVWGTESVASAQEWPLEVKDGAAGIPAGLLQRLSPGTRLAVLASPGDAVDKALGFVEVKSAKNLSARVAPVAFGGKPALSLAGLPAKPYARLTELAVDYRLKVARPAPTPGLEKETEFVNAALDRAMAAEDRTFSALPVAPGSADADIRFAVLPEGQVVPGGSDAPMLFLLPASGEIDKASPSQPPRIAIHSDDPAKLDKTLGDDLTKIYRATSLSRLSVASDYSPEDVSLLFEVKREGSDGSEPLDGATVPVVLPGDEVHFQVKNNSTRSVDLNVLYVGSDWSITHILTERLVPGASLKEGLLRFTDASFGTERMVAVLTDVPPMNEIEDLSFLAQEGVPSFMRAANEGGFASMLADIGLAPSMRSAMKLGGREEAKGGVMIFPLETRPRT